jgi:hypothetical protein
VRKGANTYLLSELYSADRLAVVILEEYGVREKLKGNVMLTLPEPEWDIPIFMFQLGGNERQKIALLDISPTLPSIDYAPVIPVFEKYRDRLRMEPSKVEWVNRICLPSLLHCQYDVLDTEVFLEATREYLQLWIDHYYLPAARGRCRPRAGHEGHLHLQGSAARQRSGLRHLRQGLGQARGRRVLLPGDAPPSGAADAGVTLPAIPDQPGCRVSGLRRPPLPRLLQQAGIAHAALGR